jgi:predicted AlkP superfamily pyrophosphatase or phosphodiesterase
MEDPKLGKFTMANSSDPRWWSAAEPLWITAGRQGLKTASMFWVGSDDLIRGARPDYWKSYDKAFLADQRVDQVLAWLDLPAEQRPNFITLYFDLVDTQGHRFGPNSKEVDEALASTDAQIGRLVEGLKARGLYARTNLIVVADHGMADSSRDRVIFIDDIAGGADRIHAVTGGANAALSIAPGAPKDTLARLLASHDHLRCWRKGDMPARFHYGRNPRVPPVVCLADVGWYITSHERLAATRDFNLGSHGYDQDDPQMAALFVAEGPAFRAGAAVPAFDNVDVEPLAAKILGLKAPRSDGSAKVFAPALSQR